MIRANRSGAGMPYTPDDWSKTAQQYREAGGKATKESVGRGGSVAEHEFEQHLAAKKRRDIKEAYELLKGTGLEDELL